MSGTTYFWQGGRKIEITHAGNSATIEVEDVAQAERALSRAGVEATAVHQIGPGLVRVELDKDRDAAMDALRQANCVHHVYCTKGHSDNEIVDSGGFFLKFKKDASDDSIRQFLNKEQLQIVEDYGENSLLVRVTDGTGMNAIRAANAAAERPDVEYAEPNLVRQLQRFGFIPADPLFQQQWHLFSPSDDPPDLVQGAGINAPDAWSETLGVRDVVVAVMDDGFDLTHPDFQGTGKVKGQLNAKVVGPFFNLRLNFDNDVHPRPGDYHGTPCLGVAVAEMNSQGTVGVAPGCALLAVRFPLNMIPESLLVDLFTRVSIDADVVSCSWGVGPSDTPMSTTLSQRISQLALTGGRRGKGLVFCVAAGNNNAPVKDLNNTHTYLYRNSLGTLFSYSGPIERWIAAHPDVMTISASTSLRTRSAYSSWGNEISVCAPSNNFHDLHSFTTIGRGIFTTDNEGFGQGSDFTPGSRFTGQFGGTSSATPTVAGVCGLVISRNQSLTGKQVQEIIESTADKSMVIDSETPVNVPGDFQNGFSQWFGHGKVNAAGAVAAAAPAGVAQVSVDKTSTDTPIDIPDVGQTIVSRIEVTEEGVVVDIRVSVDIRHTFIGDLRVDLTAPDGSSVTLHNQSGGTQNNLIRVYSADDLPAMHALIGKSIEGDWELRVADRLFFDVGHLESWRLRVKAEGGP